MFRTLITAAVVSVSFTIPSMAETVTIGHFGNPTPMQIAAAEGRFENATGWTIEWRKFGAGSDVIAAMASGDIKLAELGSSPLAIAASQGVDLELFLIAQGIGPAESLIVRDGAGIEGPEDLEGKRVAVPVGSTAHFSLMGALQHWGIDADDVQIINMPPDQINAAWSQDAIDAAFIWQPVQSKILENGRRLVGADEVAEWGFPTFDGWVVNSAFAEENPDFLEDFARVINEANAAYLDNRDAWTADSDEVKTIAEQTGAAPEQVPTILEGFTFLTQDEQISKAWLGGTAAKAMKETAQFLKEVGRIDSAAEDYSGFVNPRPAEAAAK